MIEFLTIFLHLMSGVQRVEVAAAPTVHAVVFRLDGESVARVDAAPWRADVNFGPLAYHTLEAVSYAADGTELQRIAQQINLPRRPLEARIVFDEYVGAMPSQGRVVWDGVPQGNPLRIDLRLDGTAIQVERSGLFSLPEFSSVAHHVLVAELRFPGGLSTTAEAVVGGRHSGAVKTGLTAVPVEFAEAPDRRQAAARVTVKGQAAEVVAVEQLGARIAVVQDPDSFVALRRLAEMMDGRVRSGLRGNRLVSEELIDSQANLLSLVHPCADVRTTDSGPLVLFPVLGPLTLAPKPLAWVVSHVRLEQLSKDHTKRADAVANAALRVSASTRPRAVILVLGYDGADSSQYGVAEVRSYLDSLRVPLYVWRTEKVRQGSRWPPGELISSVKKLRAAADRVESDLKRQWIVWLAGQFNPHEVQVADQREHSEDVALMR